MILISVLFCLLFLGGWDGLPAIPSLVLALKAAFVWFFFILVRATLPRYRYDQLMDIGWKVFLPLSGGFLLFVIGLLVFFNGYPVTAECSIFCGLLGTRVRTPAIASLANRRLFSSEPQKGDEDWLERARKCLAALDRALETLRKEADDPKAPFEELLRKDINRLEKTRKKVESLIKEIERRNKEDYDPGSGVLWDYSHDPALQEIMRFITAVLWLVVLPCALCYEAYSRWQGVKLTAASHFATYFGRGLARLRGWDVAYTQSVQTALAELFLNYAGYAIIIVCIALFFYGLRKLLRYIDGRAQNKDD